MNEPLSRPPSSTDNVLNNLNASCSSDEILAVVAHMNRLLILGFYTAKSTQQAGNENRKHDHQDYQNDAVRGVSLFLFDHIGESFLSARRTSYVH